jgi:multidrug resistance protein
MDSRTLQAIFIAMASLSTISATDIFLPSLPSMATYFGASDEATQLTIPIFLLGSLIGGPLLGLLSDYFPRKRVMLLGLCIFLLGTTLCAYSPSLTFLLYGRFIQGFGAIVSPVVGWAMIQDLYPGDKSAKVMSWMGSIICVAPLVAPGLGGYIHVTFGWQGNFIFIFLCAAITFILILFSKSNGTSSLPKKKLSRLNTIKTYTKILSNKIFLYYISLFAFLTFAEWCYLTLIPFYFENSLLLPPNIFGLYISGGASFYVLGASFTPMILNGLGTLKTLSLGIMLSLGGSILLLLISLFAPTFPLLIVFAVGLYFFGTAIVWGPSVSRALQCFEDARGAASAVRSFLITAASVLGGMLGSFLEDSSILPLSLFMLAMAIACWSVFQKLQKMDHTK